VAARSEARILGLSLAGIAGSNPRQGHGCLCCVFSGRGLCVELIARPKKSYRMSCDREASTVRWPWPTRGSHAIGPGGGGEL
jgi:hypothetical protein